MRFAKIAAASIAVMGLLPTSAHAYLDPGTGSIILQAIVASVASSLFVIKMYWHKVKSMLGMTRASGNDDGADAAQ
jgi:hypothetical protein